MRLSGRASIVIVAALGILIVVSTDQIVPAATVYQAQMRVWLAARAAGFTAYLILTFIVAVGLVLSHPVNKSTWKLSKHIFPWHENLFVFALAFTVVHVISIVLDPYAGVGLLGAVIPGLSTFRSVPVAIGNARPVRLPDHGADRPVHEGPAAGYSAPDPSIRDRRVRARLDARDAGWDRCRGPPEPVYSSTGSVVLMATAYRYWVSKRQRPTFAASLPHATSRPAAVAASGPAQPSLPMYRRSGHEAATSSVDRRAPCVRHARCRREPHSRRGHRPRRGRVDRERGAHGGVADLGERDLRAPRRRVDPVCRALEQQIVDLTARTADLATALAATNDRVGTDTATARTLRKQLAAAQKKLAALTRALNSPTPAQGGSTPIAAPTHPEDDD